MGNILSTTGGGKLASLIKLASSVANIPGDAAECGVWRGGSLCAIAKVLPGKTVYGFDTFSGLPKEAWSNCEIHNVGDFRDSSLEIVRENTAKFPNIILVPGIFPQTCGQLSDRSFAFVYLDFDFYLSTRDALAWFLPRMEIGGVIVFDDYEWKHCPGVKLAIDEFGLDVEQTVPHQAAHLVRAKR
jgi:O-methyltransferase